MSQKSKGIYEFGSFRLSPAEWVLENEGKAVSLTPKAFEVLCVLVENAGHITDKDELLKRVWRDTFVEEATLAKNISTIRKALGDSAEGEIYIATVPKRGYRFVAPVRVVQEAAAGVPAVQPEPAAPPARVSRRWWLGWVAVAGVALLLVLLYAAGRRGSRPSSASEHQQVTLVVLPFENLSGDPEQEYLADGITEELIAQLSRLNPKRLTVIARTSAMTYKGTRKDIRQIGSDLGANYVLEGSVRRSGKAVRINAQLIDTQRQTHVWSQQYDRRIEDILSLETSVALDVAGQVRLQLLPAVAATRSVNTDSYDDYLRGMYLWNQRTERTSQRAREYLHRAIQRDPLNARAFAALGETYAGGDALTRREKGEPAVRRALELDSTLPEAHTAMGVLRMMRYDWNGAEAEFRRAIELNPNFAHAHMWYSDFLQARGRFEEAIAEASVARRLDPLSPLIHHVLGVAYFYARRFDRAKEQFGRALELDPQNVWTRLRLAQTLAFLGDRSAAEEEFARARTLLPVAADLRFAYFQARWGRPREARKVLAEGRGPNPVDHALLRAALGDPVRAMQLLETACREQFGDVRFLAVDPRADILRGNPGFGAVLHCAGLK